MENNHYHSDPNQQQNERLRRLKWVVTFWDRMTRLYGYKWTSKEGELDTESYGFKLWLSETSHLTDEQWKRGVKRCEDEMRAKVKIGDESWPPSYVEFVEYCNEKPNGTFKRFTFALPEPEEIKQQRKERGLEHTTKILSIFDDE